jgi:diguanylate cyclase (GGDEF)-like protein
MLQKEFERALRYQRPLSLILLDVDHFKKFNDTFGHPAGDEALRQVARILLEQTRTADFVARYGGEEFVVLLSDTDQEGALLTAERLRARLEAAAWSRAPLTASLGVATLQERTPRGSELTEQADQALYASKQQGRNRVTHYRWLENPVLHQASEESGIRAR